MRKPEKFLTRRDEVAKQTMVALLRDSVANSAKLRQTERFLMVVQNRRPEAVCRPWISGE